MKLGIMQPYFFPYLGHFALIAHTDRWIVFDITQYTPKTYMSRNEVLKQGGGRQRIFAQLNNSSIHIKTFQASLADPAKTHQQVLGSLSHYKKFARHYNKVIQVLDRTFKKLERSSNPLSLVELNIAGLESVCEYLNLPFNYSKASSLRLNIPQAMQAGQWAPLICQQLNATGYLNPIGGKALFNPEDFEQIVVTLEFLEMEPMQYPVKPYLFEPNLSILDVLMWNNPEEIVEHLVQKSKPSGSLFLLN